MFSFPEPGLQAPSDDGSDALRAEAGPYANDLIRAAAAGIQRDQFPNLTAGPHYWETPRRRLARHSSMSASRLAHTCGLSSRTFVTGARMNPPPRARVEIACRT